MMIIAKNIWNYRLSFNYFDVKNADFTEITSQKICFCFCFVKLILFSEDSDD